MKKLIFALFSIMMTTGIMAQVPQGITHQAVMRDSQNQPIVESPIGVRISILQGSVDGEAVYVETHTPVSNANGLITYVIGQGVIESGVFAEIDWSDGPYFLKTESDPAGGTDYIISGVTQFLSVPFAFFADSFSGLDEILSRIEDLEEALDIGGPEPGTLTDIDGNVYQTVIIGTQEWMKENLKTTHYNNGAPIENITEHGDWESNTTGAFAWFGNDIQWKGSYGALYNWYAVANTNGLCPPGWVIPSDSDLTQLMDYLISTFEDVTASTAGNMLKSCRQINSPLENDCNTDVHPRWNEHEAHFGTDLTGFSALPGGSRQPDFFGGLGSHGHWWSSTPDNDTKAWMRRISFNEGHVDRWSSDKVLGYSVRCIKE